MREVLERARARFVAVVGVHERPERLAGAWALGIAIGLSPLFGLHTVMALVLAMVLKLNKVDVLLGTLIVNPWTLTFYFPAAVLLGKRVTGVTIPHLDLPRPQEFLHLSVWHERAPWVRSVALAWGVGATLFALVAGSVTYYALRRLIAVHRARHPRASPPGS